jgi:hypothetical protein
MSMTSDAKSLWWLGAVSFVLIVGLLYVSHFTGTRTVCTGSGCVTIEL